MTTDRSDRTAEEPQVAAERKTNHGEPLLTSIHVILWAAAIFALIFIFITIVM